jgi:hypothetical protein
VYAFGFYTGDTLAVSRYDVGSGNVRTLKYRHDGAKVGGSKSELHGGIGVYMPSNDLAYVAATAEDPDDQRLASVVVVKFDWAKDGPTLVVNNKFDDQLAREMVDEKYFQNYKIRDLKVTPGGDYMIFVEQIHKDEYTYRKANMSSGIQRDNHGLPYGSPGYNYGSSAPTTYTEVTVPIMVAGPLTLFSYDHDGSPKWRNAFKKTQKGPLDAGLTELSYSSLFDHSGNVQLLYLDRVNNGLQWGTLQAETGKPGAFRQLMDFGPTAMYLRPSTLWLSDDTAIITGISFSLGAMDLQLFKVKLPLDLTVGGK